MGAAECCECLVCAGKYCAEVPKDEGEVCAVDGEKSLHCGSKKGKEFCCEGLVCHGDQYWRCVTEENKSCSGPDTLAKDCGSKWKYAQNRAAMVLLVILMVNFAANNQE